ncbi:STAS domain-containing protein [Dactylosporangium aurantiacum]|uniref:STAS domain-containing protein n=1 Tax=Dactylosporangium aurantiacum TaxID=35754 RepID=A0A9Q9MJB4_9ACTN|nr:STAS domain-containing protein [Dactylosporangium aurantiacum]MDG6103983.1 STAS domain-containing protein [Dactylosporangium aurantiacum]UWZ58839.1 STAS domain-containing protein [Dactylosporangium aurantiacum]
MLDVHVHVHGIEETRLILNGVLSAATTEALRAHLDRHLAGNGIERLVIDLAQVRRIEATGVQLLLRATRAAALRGVALQLRSAPPPLRQAIAEHGIADLPH